MTTLPLHLCFHCKSDLAYPLKWSEEEDREWNIVIRCPECEAKRQGIFDQATVERLDDETDRGYAILTSEYAELTRRNMEDALGELSRALRDDLITADDFA